MRLKKQIYAVIMAVLLAVFMTGCSEVESQTGNHQNINSEKTISEKDIPAYSGEMTIALNNNEPDFSEEEMTKDSYESYSNLDSEGRCQTAQACIGKDIMPTKKREAIGMIKPTGWHTVKYDSVDGKYLYNRCHLIAHQLTGENANEKNLITGTRSFNVDGMLPYEEMVGDYVRETGNHVLYRVTPVFEGNNLVAKGVQMEAMSVEDKGKDIEFNVFVYNVQDGVDIDYETGESSLSSEKSKTTDNSSVVIRGNKRSKVYHCPGQKDYENMADSKYLVIFHSEKEAKKAGYRKAQR